MKEKRIELLAQQENAENLTSDNGEKSSVAKMSVGDVAKAVGEAWKTISAEEKQVRDI